MEKLERLKEEKEKEKQDVEIQIRQLDMMIKEAREAHDKEEEQGKIFNELEEARQKHLREYKKNVTKGATCKKIWLDYLVEGLKFANYDEAKAYARDFWISEGMDESIVISFLKLDLVNTKIGIIQY